MGADRRRVSYITPAGFAKLEAELEHLLRVERPRVTREVSEAAALGDRSENAEYIYGKKRLREIDRRIRFLSKRLDELSVVREPPERRDRVYFGATVELVGEDGEGLEVRLVGPDEADARAGTISIASPLGRALLGRSLDDAFVFRRPKGEIGYTVVAIRYDA